MNTTNLLHFTSGGMIIENLRFGNLQYLRQDAETPAAPRAEAGGVTLSRRQEQVLRLMVEGRSNKHIARELGLGEGTVKVHVAALFHKLGVASRTAAAVAGAKLLASLPPKAATDRETVEVVRTHPFGPTRFARAG